MFAKDVMVYKQVCFSVPPCDVQGGTFELYNLNSVLDKPEDL